MRYVVDIDNTIFYSEVDGNGDYTLVGENRELIYKINKLHSEGHEIILWTGRHWNHLKITEEQLWLSGVRYNTLIMGKPVADFYIDDLSITPEEFLRRHT